MTGRLPCLVPGCRRTLKPGEADHSEGICAKHWPSTSKRHRALLSKVRRKAKRIGWTPQLSRLEARLWDRLKTEAIEIGVGLR